MKILHCLFIALEGAAIVVGLGLAIAALRYLLWPAGWLINAYWEWVQRNVESDFFGVLLAIVPIFALVVAIAVFIVCLGH
jgi:hypothetical protein